MNNYENAVKYQRLGLEAAVKYLPEGDFAHMVILNRLGLSAIEINDLDTALEAFLEYQRVANKLNLDVNHAMNLFNLGNIYYLKKDYEKAKEYYFKSEDMLEDDKETSFGYSELCFMLAQIYLVENNKECAIKYYLISKEIKKRVIIDEDVLNKFIEYYDKIFL